MKTHPSLGERQLPGARLAECRAAFPELEVDGEAWTAWLMGRAPADADPGRTIAELHLEDLYLAFACLEGHPKALSRFDRTFRPQVLAALGGPSQHTLVDEVMQRLTEKLFVARDGRPPKIAEYSGRSSLGRWVRAVAVRLATDVVREPGAREIPRAPDDFATIALPADAPELALFRARYGDALRTALRRAFESLPSETRIELRQYYFDGVGVEHLGRLYRVAPSTISRRLARARSLVLDETRRILRQESGTPEDDLSSVLRLVQTAMTTVARSLRDAGNGEPPSRKG